MTALAVDKVSGSDASPISTLLGALGRDGAEGIAICTLDGTEFRAELTSVEKVGAVVEPLTERDCWFSVQPLHARVTVGRGRARDVVGLRDLYADLDVKAGGMPDEDAARAVIDDLAGMLGAMPTGIVSTGHGLQPHWAIERGADTDWPDEHHPSWAAAKALLRRWGRLVADVADKRGGAVDPVYDLARVLRAPGTTNCKAEPVRTGLTLPGGPPVSIERLREVLTECNVPEMPEDHETLGEVVAPVGSWRFGERTCTYVTSMTAGWTSDTTTARHPWLVNQATRLAAAHRLGCITGADHAVASQTLATRFRYLLGTGKVRSEGRGEVRDAFTWGVARVESKTDEQAGAELADHEHRPVTAQVSAARIGTVAPRSIRRADAHAAEHDSPGSVGLGPASAEVRSSWAPVNLTPFLDGTHEPAMPTIMPRSDGVNLLYAGKVHSFHGESESGKSWAAMIAASQQLVAGERVLFIDFEDEAASATQRLLALGVPGEAIAASFVYVRPEVDPRRSTIDAAQFAGLLAQRFALAVIDGVTDALGTFGFKVKDNDDNAEWLRVFPRRIADRTGAAVVIIDHVVKDAEGRGRFAIGAQSKMAGLTGAAYTIEVAEHLGRGLRGVVVLRIGKDRPGSIRAHCGSWRKGDRTQEAARIVIDSTDPTAMVVTISAPSTGADTGRAAIGFRPTALMEKVSRIVEAEAGLSKNKIVARVGSQKSAVFIAIDTLVSEDYLTVTAGTNNAQMHTSAKAYRQHTDPASDSYVEDRNHRGGVFGG